MSQNVKKEKNEGKRLNINNLQINFFFRKISVHEQNITGIIPREALLNT